MKLPPPGRLEVIEPRGGWPLIVPVIAIPLSAVFAALLIRTVL